jgi:four helix bundle protein
MGKDFKLENIKAYQIGSKLSDYVWNIVKKWDWLPKRTLGVQWIDSTDSISGNIAEGFGRFHRKDKTKFYYNSRASVFESAHWCKKAFKRKLINKKGKDHILTELRKLPKEINTLIKLTLKNLNK